DLTTSNTVIVPAQEALVADTRRSARQLIGGSRLRCARPDSARCENVRISGRAVGRSCGSTRLPPAQSNFFRRFAAASIRRVARRIGGHVSAYYSAGYGTVPS